MKWLSDLVVPFWVKPLLIVVLVLGLYAYAFVSGVGYESKKIQATQNAEIVKKQKTILELTTMNRELERKAAEDNTTINNLYQEKKQNDQAKTNSIINDVRTGHKRMYVNTKPPARTSDRSEASTNAAIRLGSDETTRSELSEADAEFLISYSSEADEVVNQLKLCQGKLLIDRNLPVPDLQLVPIQLESKE